MHSSLIGLTTDFSRMNTSTTTLEDIEEKLKTAEERKKQFIEERIEKLSEQDKHAQEVREKKIQSNNNSNGDSQTEQEKA